MDQGLPVSAAERLTRRGYPSEHASRLGLAHASDPELLRVAAEQGAVMLTLDSDFHRLIALANAERPSVILLRDQGLKGEGVAELVAAVAARHERELTAGALLTVRGGTIRIRALPIYGGPPS